MAGLPKEGTSRSRTRSAVRNPAERARTAAARRARQGSSRPATVRAEDASAAVSGAERGRSHTEISSSAPTSGLPGAGPNEIGWDGRRSPPETVAAATSRPSIQSAARSLENTNATGANRPGGGSGAAMA